MSKPRIDPWALNPEKFLASESKKMAAEPPSVEELVPITFSRTRRKALIARLVEKVPEAFFRGNDMAEIQSALTAIQREIKQDLEAMGVRSDDEMLVQFLLFDVMRDPDWKRTWRSRNP